MEEISVQKLARDTLDAISCPCYKAKAMIHNQHKFNGQLSEAYICAASWDVNGSFTRVMDGDVSPGGQGDVSI